MNDTIINFIMGFVLYFIFSLIAKKIFKLNEGAANIITIISIGVIMFLYGKDIKSIIGLTDGEIKIAEGFKPFKVYNKLKISNFKFNQIYIETEKSSLGKTFDKENYVIEYSANIINKGEPIITIDDPNGTLPISFRENLVLSKLDGVDGKDSYINFGEVVQSDLFKPNGEKIEYSTKNPIQTGEEFICVGKIVLDKENFNYLSSRKYESNLYITFSGTTKEKYSEPNGYGFIIKQDSYSVNLSEFVANHSKELKRVTRNSKI